MSITEANRGLNENGRTFAAAPDMKPKSRLPLVRWAGRFVAISLGLIQIVLARNTVGPDARSYLEIARAILRHDWAMTINAYWSALYPWLLAADLAIFKPSLREEFPVAHALAFPLLLACIAAFEFFWSSLLRREEEASESREQGVQPIPPVQMWILGYSFFIWSTVGGIVTAINPDLCMTTMALLAAGLLVRITNGTEEKRSLYVWFGICLGVGYLTKAILFPMGVVFLIVMALASWRVLRVRAGNFLIPLVIFAMIASPEIALLSRSKGRFTFSDTGKLAFAWYTYDLPLRNWQGQPAWSGKPLHPTRKIKEHPAVYEFNGPLRSSYPPWYDPSYWNDGLAPKFQWGVVIRHVLGEILKLGEILTKPAAWALGILAILAGCDLRKTIRAIAAHWYLILISAAAFAAHCLTLVESRYLVPWEILLWGAVLAGVRLRRNTARWYGLVTAIVAAGLLTSMVRLERGEAVHGFHNDASAECVTAEGLQQMDLTPGTPVGAIGFDNDAYWAYLLRLNIVAEINTDETCFFWGEPAEAQAQILDKFAQAGASVVVANTGDGIRSTSTPVPIPFDICAHPGAGWRRIPGSRDYAFFLK